MKLSLVEMTNEHFPDWKEIVEQPALSLDAYTMMLERLITEQKQDRHYQYLVKNEHDEIIGSVGLFNVWRSEFRMALLDYAVKPAFRRKGFALEALRILETKAYSDLKLKKLVGYVEMENTAGHQLLTKAGFQSTVDQNGFIDKNGTSRPAHVFVKILSMVR